MANVGNLNGNGQNNSNTTLDGDTGTYALLGEGNDQLTLINNSSLSGRVNAGGGDDTLNIDGTSSIAGQVEMSSGIDAVNLDGGTLGSWVDLGSSNDSMTITGGSVNGYIYGSLDDDQITITDGTVGGDVRGDRGLSSDGASEGDDTLTIEDSAITGIIAGDGGNDNISITNSSATSISGGDGNDQITLSDINITGTVSGDGGNDNFTVSSLANNIIIDGNEDTGDSDTDTLDLSALTGEVVYDSANPENGVFTEEGTRNTITFSNIENVTAPIAPVCFTTGMAIMTATGEKNVEDLKIGDLVPTFDNGPKPIRYIYARTLPLSHLSMPICFEPNTIGNDRKLVVSQKHSFHTGSLPKECIPKHAVENDDHLIHADMFINGSSIRYDLSQKAITYFHIMFDKHELIQCHGTWSESWHPIRRAVKKDKAMCDEIVQLFPEILRNNPTNTPAVRQFGTSFILKPNERLFKYLSIQHQSSRQFRTPVLC